MQENITAMQKTVATLKAKRKQIMHHIAIGELSEADRFTRLRTEQKHFLDTIKMIAYRAESSMVEIARENMARLDDARALIRRICDTEVDFIPNLTLNTLTIRLHHSATNAHDQTIQHLCNDLNDTETIFPGTKLKILYEIGSTQNHASQEV